MLTPLSISLAKHIGSELVLMKIWFSFVLVYGKEELCVQCLALQFS